MLLFIFMELNLKCDGYQGSHDGRFEALFLIMRIRLIQFANLCLHLCRNTLLLELQKIPFYNFEF